MSRFYNQASSDSESETESSDNEAIQQPKVGATARAFMFSDDEDDVKRVVRSEKEKRYEEIRNVIKQLRNHKKIKDMANVLQDFENLGKAYDKAKKVVEKEGTPRFYVRALVELDDFVAQVWEDREGRKNMSKNNSKGLSALRQKLKKYLRDFETDVAEYREAPDPEGAETESEAESDSESEEEPARKPVIADFFKKKPTPTKGGEEQSDSESDDDSWTGDEIAEESSSSSDDGGENLAMKFLKKTADKDDDKEEKKKKKKQREQRVREGRDEMDGEGWQEVKGGAPMMKRERPKMFAKDAEITHDAVIGKLYEIIAVRGKKGTDRNEQISLLLELEEIANANTLGPAVQMTIIFHMIAAVYDYNTNIATCMKGDMWEKCLEHIVRALDIIESTPDMIVSENISEETQVLKEAPYRVRGCVLSIIERMDDEFTKMLQACDAHSNEYVDRLRDESRVCELIDRVQIYMEKKGTADEICRIYQRRIEHLYYKFDFTRAKALRAKENGEEFEFPEGYLDSEQCMDRLCKYIYKHDSTNRIRTRAILCHIYHHALHDNWFEARDLMLMSHLQDTIQHSDVPTQILYNRSMVQLGLCAFRKGMIKDAHHALVDIQSGGRAKELLAQGLLLQRQHERTPEQEKIEKRRQMPYHKHINLELLECVYLVSAMLLEIPYMAAHELDARRRMISKNFHHVLRLSERQPLIGPPETMREHIVAASKAMKTGDWKACNGFIVNEKMNAKVWDLFFQADKVRSMMTRKIQEESLRTYLFTYSSVYDSISLLSLADMFQLEKATIHSIISKMIINEELMASLDEPTQTVVMHRTEPSRLQALCLQLAEKVTALVDNNERIFEMKQGNFFGFQKQGYQQQNQFGQSSGQQQNWGQSKYQQNSRDSGNNWGRNYNRQAGGGRQGGNNNQWQGRRNQRTNRAY